MGDRLPPPGEPSLRSTPSANTAATDPARAYFPALDGLRALAVLGVLAFHEGWALGGFLGVDLFFVLSGFLITRLLLLELAQSGRVSVLGFWQRRIARLFPALITVVLVVAAWTAWAGADVGLRRVRREGLFTLIYVANWGAIADSHGYWRALEARSPFEHTWSLAIEEQFYLGWPTLISVGVWATRGRPRRLVGALLLAAAMSAFALASLWLPTDPTRAYLGTDTRAAALLVGAGLAALLVGRGAVGGPAVPALGLASFVALGVVWAAATPESAWLFHGGLFASEIAVAWVLATAVLAPQAPLTRALSARPLREIGAISYAIYLWHVPVAVMLDAPRTGLSGALLGLLHVAVTVALAAASGALVERPLRAAILRSGRVGVALTLGAVFAAACALVLATREPSVADVDAPTGQGVDAR